LFPGQWGNKRAPVRHTVTIKQSTHTTGTASLSINKQERTSTVPVNKYCACLLSSLSRTSTVPIPFQACLCVAFLSLKTRDRKHETGILHTACTAPQFDTYLRSCWRMYLLYRPSVIHHMQSTCNTRVYIHWSTFKTYGS
jgi:hypothetical protein